jgi:hypothetical protein
LREFNRLTVGILYDRLDGLSTDNSSTDALDRVHGVREVCGEACP